jgi:hypothetical protein
MLPHSRRYHLSMQRLVVLIALVFAVASLAGMTTAHAHRYVSTPIVVLNHVNSDNVAIPVMVHIQRGEIDLGSGIFLPCGPHNAITTTMAPVLPGAPEGDAPLAALHDQLTPWLGERLLRPPRAA